MANILAWIGIFLGLALGGTLVFLAARHGRRRKLSSLPAQGLFISGEEPAALSAPPASEGVEAVSPAGESQASPGEAKTEKTGRPDKPRVRSLADSLHAPTGLQGNLAQVSLFDFLQFLGQGKRTGLLEIVSGRRHGYLRFERGSITLSSFRGRHGLSALHAMLPLAEGDYEFFEGDDMPAPDAVEGIPTHEPFDVVEVLIQWGISQRASGNGAIQA